MYSESFFELLPYICIVDDTYYHEKCPALGGNRCGKFYFKVYFCLKIRHMPLRIKKHITSSPFLIIKIVITLISLSV